MLRRSIVALTPCIALLAGCGLVPSDPVVAPIGFRLDGDVISVLIPRCAGQAVTAAKVEQLDESGTWTKSWEASDFTGELTEAIRFEDADWAVSAGTYSTSDGVVLDLSVSTSGATYGAGQVGIDEIRGLPAGDYMVDYATMDVTEYLAEVADYPCPRNRIATNSPEGSPSS